ncbi:hypothetical protein [Paraburkholderia unamae]|uniref:Uncharacterized protein n=1 Tax=Paraburkholderia unamae TaxID=219649 RepID=A0ACC6RFP3_9BURK
MSESHGFLHWEARFIHELLPYARAARGFVSRGSWSIWHRFYSVANPLMRAFPAGAYATLGAPRHWLIDHLLNRLNQSGLDFPILPITGCALSDKARDDVIDASECCWTPFGAGLKGMSALDTMPQASVTVANAHKSGLQSFGGFLCL